MSKEAQVELLQHAVAVSTVVVAHGADQSGGSGGCEGYGERGRYREKSVHNGRHSGREGPQLQWDLLRRWAAAAWVQEPQALVGVVERLAGAAFQYRRDPLDACLFYGALGKVRKRLIGGDVGAVTCGLGWSVSPPPPPPPPPI